MHVQERWQKMKNKKEEYLNANNLLAMIMPLLALILQPSAPLPPHTVINIYSDKKLDIKND